MLPELPEKHAGGRPTLYNRKMGKQAMQLAQLGYTNLQIANFYEVSEDTLYEWLKIYPEFSEWLKKGREETDIKVMSALLKRALGYDLETIEETFEKDGDKVALSLLSTGEMITNEGYKKKVVKKKIHVPPDVGAQKIWLGSHQRKVWGGPVEGEGNTTNNYVQINIRSKKKDESADDATEGV